MASQINNAEELRTRSEDELGTFIEEKAEELFKLRFQQFTGQLENTARMGQVRREIARAKGILHEKQGGAKKSGSRAERAERRAQERSAS